CMFVTLKQLNAAII
ncbi:hypothetical protein A2U01_0116499, partial [Trifolium medium]|nr:hypothetical protein [Trifolium medium]